MKSRFRGEVWGCVAAYLKGGPASMNISIDPATRLAVSLNNDESSPTTPDPESSFHENSVKTPPTSICANRFKQSSTRNYFNIKTERLY